MSIFNFLSHRDTSFSNVTEEQDDEINVLNLEKGNTLDLSKNSTLTNIRIGAGWDVNVDRYGSNYDLDLCAGLYGENGNKIDTVYYGNRCVKGIRLSEDNLTGEGSGEDEKMFVNFKDVSPEVKKIVVGVAIYNAGSRGQSFKGVKNAFVRLVDQDQHDKVLCKFNLTEDGGDNTAVRFAEIYRENNGWSFKAVGEYGNASVHGI